MEEIQIEPGQTAHQVFEKAFKLHLNVNMKTIEQSQIESKFKNEFVSIPTKDISFQFNGSTIMIIGGLNE